MTGTYSSPSSMNEFQRIRRMELRDWRAGDMRVEPQATAIQRLPDGNYFLAAHAQQNLAEAWGIPSSRQPFAGK